MNKRLTVRLLIFLAAGLGGCATTKTTKDHDFRQRVLDAVVVGREFEPLGGARVDAAGFGGWQESSGTWYLVLEARDGEAQAHYRVACTWQQYMRFGAGEPVQVTMVGYELRDVRRRP